MSYYLNLETPLQVIPQKFTEWITTEVREEGLLEEIDQVCNTYRTEGPVLSHEIWIRKEDWTVPDEQIYSLGDGRGTIVYPFTVAIIVDMIDEETSEQKALQLQAKTIMALFKNFSRNIFDDPNDGWINTFKLDTGYNDGSLDALNREDDVIIKGFHVTFEIEVDWLNCVRKQENENGG